VNALSYLTVLIGLSRISLPPYTPVPALLSPLEGIREGLAYVLGDRRVRGLVEVVTVFSILGIPYLSLMPVMAREMLGLGAGGFGVMLSAVGIGGLAGALGLAAFAPRSRGRLLVHLDLLRGPAGSCRSSASQPRACCCSRLAAYDRQQCVGEHAHESIVPDAFPGA
jgi:hypothetical protein